MKKILLALTAIVTLLIAMPALAQINVLVVHNCPSKEADTVDVWANVPSIGDIRLLDNMAFRSAYFLRIGYPALPMGSIIVVADKNSTSTASPIFSKPVGGLTAGNYTIVATGLVDSTIKTNPSGIRRAFDLEVSSGVNFTSGDPNKANLIIQHGVVDAPAVTVRSFITTIQSTPQDTLVPTAPFRAQTAGMLYNSAPHRIHIFPTGSSTAVYKANGDALKLLGGKTAFVFASGFLDTTGTGTKNTFKIFAAVVDTALAGAPPLQFGQMTVVELPAEKVAGTVQVYHNAADPKLKNLDLYVGGIKQMFGISFRNGFQSGLFIQDFDYNLALKIKDSSSNVLTHTLRMGPDSAVMVISGVLNPAQFAVNPDGENRALAVYTNTPTRQTTAANTTQVTVFHGATDAPTVGLNINPSAPVGGGAPLIVGLKYGKFQVASIGGSSVLPTSLGSVIVDLKLPGGATYKSYIVPLSALDGKAVTVCASGFVDTSAANQGGPSFKIFAGLPASPFPQIVFLKDTSIVMSINDPATADLSFRMFPNPATDNLVVGFDATEQGHVAIDILDMNGRVVKQIMNEVVSKGTTYRSENIADLSNGLYVARVVSGNKVSTYKFNVMH